MTFIALPTRAQERAKITPSMLLHANLAARYVYLSRAREAALRREPEMTWFTTPIAAPGIVFNVVFHARFASPGSAERHIAQVLADARERGVAYYWLVGPGAAPADLGERLARAGLRRITRATGMALELARLRDEAPPVPGLSIRLVESHAALRDFIGVVARNTQMDADAARQWFRMEAQLGLEHNHLWKRYVGWLNGEPVATSSLVVGGGAAGLYSIATLPQARGRGIATALSLAALRQGRDYGHRTAVLLSTPEAVSLYRRLGFEAVSAYDIYEWKPGDTAH